MKFSNFLFPASTSSANDFDVIQDALREAELSDALGFDTIWLAEHHLFPRYRRGSMKMTPLEIWVVVLAVSVVMGNAWIYWRNGRPKAKP